MDVKEYLSRAGIRRVTQLDTAILEAYGQEEGERHIDRLTRLFELSEKRLVYGAVDMPYLRRQEELVEYLNQSLEMSLLAASFYDRVFFRRVMEYLLQYGRFVGGEIFDIGCGNGILTCFLALKNPNSAVTGLELSGNAISVARELAGRLSVGNVHFADPGALLEKKCDTLFSCRTVHENVPWRPLREENGLAPLSGKEQVKRHGKYARELAALVKPQGYLVSVERYEDDSAYAGLAGALERAGFCQVKGTHMQFSCKNGDETAAFQAMVYRKENVWK